MRIAICDDYKDDAEKLYKMVKEVLDEKRIAVTIKVFDNGETLLKNSNFDIYFLDIYMGELDGVKVGYELSKKDSKNAIVFTTTSKDHMADSYSIGALHYLVKPFTKADVNTALERCLRVVKHVDPYLEVLINRVKKKILTAKIRYIESQNRFSYIYTDFDVYKVYLRLEDLKKMLHEEKFLRCHRSYLINLDYVDRIVDNDFILNDGTLIPLKRNQKILYKTYYEDYLFKQVRERDT